jgi:hypothetical protein
MEINVKVTTTTPSALTVNGTARNLGEYRWRAQGPGTPMAYAAPRRPPTTLTFQSLMAKNVEISFDVMGEAGVRSQSDSFPCSLVRNCRVPGSSGQLRYSWRNRANMGINSLTHLHDVARTAQMGLDGSRNL